MLQVTPRHGRGEASGEGRGWCAVLRLQDAQPNACQGRLERLWDTFQLKGAEWADVKAGSHDAAVRAQARSRPKYEAIAAARASTSSSAPDLELTNDAG